MLVSTFDLIQRRRSSCVLNRKFGEIGVGFIRAIEAPERKGRGWGRRVLERREQGIVGEGMV
jgi:hypothetical protein